MNDVDHLRQNRTESRLLEKKVEMKTLGVHQQEDQTNDRQLLEVKEEEEEEEEEVPHLWSSGLDQQDPELLVIKKEEEDLWSSQEGEQLPVTSEDEKSPQLFQLHRIKTEDDRETEPPTSSSAEQMKTETDEEDCGGPEPDPAGSRAKWRSACSADVQQVLIKEEVSSEWSSSLDQQDPELLKEEEEEHWSSQEGEQDITRFPYNKYDEEKLESLKLYELRTEENGETDPPTSRLTEHVKTETDGEDEEGPKLHRNPDPNSHLKQTTDEETSGSCVTKVHDEDWQEPLSDSEPETEFMVETKKSVHAGKKALHCDVCGKVFKYHFYLKKHATVHTREKPHVCGVCNKRFSLQGNLQRHMSYHTKEKPFGCDVCGYRFNEKIYLTKHMRVHATEKRCEICGKGLRYPSDVVMHMRVHTGEAPFHCDVCGKNFKYKGDLKKHKIVHTGETPFECDVCGKTFKYKCNLHKHEKIHTGEAPFPCSVCNKTFTYKSSLKTHLSVHNPEKSPGQG
ncbi:zinc finger protein 37 homolog isoform X1 [Kryptolebias marmoratus]|uniref:zinc finger protein 37 homolog isoform X1 n=1 Tax=Kryptolebias marmoratus TaxID=37003 RepID=UPI000D5304BD|nr:zinc finger protein 37 homolog isoform X1 [Kryptolebias marmoratus]